MYVPSRWKPHVVPRSAQRASRQTCLLPAALRSVLVEGQRRLEAQLHFTGPVTGATVTGRFLVYYKRLERHRFSMPRIPEGATQVTLDATSLAMLLDGVDLRAVKRAPRWEPARAKKRAEGIDISRAS